MTGPRIPESPTLSPGQMLERDALRMRDVRRRAEWIMQQSVAVLDDIKNGVDHRTRMTEVLSAAGELAGIGGGGS